MQLDRKDTRVICNKARFTLDALASVLWGWNERARRYVDQSTGRFLSPSALVALQRRNIRLIEGDLRTVGELLIEGKLSLKSFQEAFAQTLKQLHLHQMVLARGGTQAANANDYLAVARHLKGEYQFLRGLAVDINRGYSVGTDGKQTPLTVGHFRQRVRLYAKRGRLSYETGRQANAQDQGHAYSWRTLGATDRHCASCLRYAALGIQPLGSLPVPTAACECGGNCQCTLHTAVTLAEAIARTTLAS